MQLKRNGPISSALNKHIKYFNLNNLPFGIQETAWGLFVLSGLEEIAMAMEIDTGNGADIGRILALFNKMGVTEKVTGRTYQFLIGLIQQIWIYSCWQVSLFFDMFLVLTV